MTSYETVKPDELDYFDGTRTIVHDDGSTTYINYTHEPYVEPLSPKAQAAVIGATVLGVIGIIALPFGLERMEEWSRFRAEKREIKKQKKLAALKDEAATTPND